MAEFPAVALHGPSCAPSNLRYWVAYRTFALCGLSLLRLHPFPAFSAKGEGAGHYAVGSKSILTSNIRHLTSKIRPMSIRTRFAPSPTGYLHIGGVRTA